MSVLPAAAVRNQTGRSSPQVTAGQPRGTTPFEPKSGTHKTMKATGGLSQWPCPSPMPSRSHRSLRYCSSDSPTHSRSSDLSLVTRDLPVFLFFFSDQCSFQKNHSNHTPGHDVLRKKGERKKRAYPGIRRAVFLQRGIPSDSSLAAWSHPCHWKEQARSSHQSRYTHHWYQSGTYYTLILG